MNKSTTAAIGAALIVWLAAGCTPVEAPVKAEPTASTPSPTPTPTIDPGPVTLTTEEAAARYLDIICPRNATAKAFDDGLSAWEQTYFNGGSPNIDEVRAAAAAGLDASYNAVVLIDDTYYVWPEAVRPHLAAVRGSLMDNVASYDGVKNSADYEATRLVSWPDQSGSASAGQEIRLALSIPPDTTASCVGHENGQATLLAEKAEREAALAER